MGFYSRNNEEQSRLTDEVYAAIQRCKGVVLGDGHLSAETKQEPRSIYAALELLEEEGKITITVTSNAREECKGR
jgi:hypothetical protein